MRTLTLALFAMMSVACSNQWRDSGGADATSMLAALSEVSSAQASAVGGDLQSALAMKDQEGVRIYFAESMLGLQSPMGPAGSVVSLGNFGFLGDGSISWRNIDQARVFFFDLPAQGGHQFGLIVGYRKTGESAMTYAGYTGTGGFADDEMTVTLQSGGVDKVVLRSYDASGEDLDQVIQLEVYDVGADGGEHFNGKFPSLLGFGD